MTPQELFTASEEALTKIVDQIEEEQWSLPVPQSISDKGLTLRQLITYHAYDDAWVPDVLAGKTIAEVGTKYDGDLLGDNPKASWHAIVEKAITAVKKHSDLEDIVHLSYGDYPAREYLWHISTFRTFRAVDLARFLGLDDTLPASLVEGMWEMLQSEVENWRKMGIFEPEVQVPQNATKQQKLLGLVGKQP